MKTYEIFKHGSTWLKADFHLHTRRDAHTNFPKESEQKEHEFQAEYINALVNADISIGVITNHNKFNFHEFKGLRKEAEKQNIYLLPGIELSVKDGNDGIHALIVFNDSWIVNQENKDYINNFIGIAFGGQPNFDAQIARSNHDINETIRELDKFTREYFIVWAHVDATNGLFNGLSNGRLAAVLSNDLFKMRTLGFQKVRTRDKQTEVKNIMGKNYPAEVEGSDCKCIEEIGSKDSETWLKIGDFTFEAVKYALVDYQNRVRSTKPERYKHSHIKRISFEGGTLNGQTVHLSPELNTFIGIRGSGKSSILEAVRYVLDYPLEYLTSDRDKRERDIEYKKDLVAHTLGSGGKAVITAIDQYGSEFQIRRILNEFPEVYFNNKSQPGVSIRETIIKNPIYFGQKDLAASGKGFEKELVEKLVGDSLYDIRRQIEEKKQIVSDFVLRLQKVANIDEQIAEYTQKKQDAEFNLGKFKEYGIEEKFKKQTDFDTDERKIKQILTDIDSYKSDLDSFISQHEDAIKNHQVYSSQQNQSFFASFLEEYKKIVSILEKHKSDSTAIAEIKKALEEKYLEFTQTKKTFTDEFADTRRKIETDLKEKGAAALHLEEYPALKGKIDTAMKMLDALNKQKSQASSIKNELLQALTELNNLWQQEFQAIKAQLDKINNKQSALTIEAEFKGDKTGFLSFMKNMFRGSGIRENTLSTIVNEYSDFGALYRDFENAKKNTGSSPETFEKYFLENLKDLLIYQVQNRFTIKYRGKELQHHSLGQRASALILFVLNQQENDLIIVDQPEDDLDNQTIYEDVIKLIRELKPHTQFVFATHNANFPVLGDAEQIHSCRYEDDTITIHIGSIDSPVLQKEIVDIMEGGEDAFNKRKEIYGIWKPQNL